VAQLVASNPANLIMQRLLRNPTRGKAWRGHPFWPPGFRNASVCGGKRSAAIVAAGEARNVTNFLETAKSKKEKRTQRRSDAVTQRNFLFYVKKNCS
jgi:hypothetical protein